MSLCCLEVLLLLFFQSIGVRKQNTEFWEEFTSVHTTQTCFQQNWLNSQRTPFTSAMCLITRLAWIADTVIVNSRWLNTWSSSSESHTESVACWRWWTWFVHVHSSMLWIKSKWTQMRNPPCALVNACRCCVDHKPQLTISFVWPSCNKLNTSIVWWAASHLLLCTLAKMKQLSRDEWEYIRFSVGM